MPYEIDFSPEALEHLGDLMAREQATVLNHIEVQLTHEPDVETRRRKQLRPNPLFPWELRVEDLRVFYDIDAVTKRVTVLAIGRKRGNRLLIAGKEIIL